MNKRCFSIVAAVLFLPLAGLAQNGMIRGKVRTGNNNTVNDALVELRQDSGGVVGQVVTRTDGDFAFGGLRPGNYEIFVQLSGYEPVAQMVKIGNTSYVGRPNPDNPSEIISVEITIRPLANASPGLPGVTFAQDVPKPAREAYEKGIAKIREGKSAEGVVFLREATEKFSHYFDAHFALGCEYYRMGKDAEALESLEQARLINERGAAVYYMFGMVMVRQQKFRVAEYGFGKAVELNETNPLAHFNHGVALLEIALRATDAGEVKTFLTQAEQEMNKTWDLTNKRMNAVYLQRARIQERRGNKEAAARELENYLKAEPNAKNAEPIRESIKRLREKQ
jgi:tetratricopeptide (TPR) repeat protein